MLREIETRDPQRLSFVAASSSEIAIAAGSLNRSAGSFSSASIATPGGDSASFATLAVT